MFIIFRNFVTKITSARIPIVEMAGLAILILVFDMLSKSYAALVWAKNPWFPLEGLGDSNFSATWLEFGYSQNPGIAFGLPITGTPLLVLNILLILALVVYAAFDFHTTSAKLALGLILGGALGNLYDRVTLGVVRDFLRIGFWPMFNLADTAIVVGVALLLFHFYHLSSHSHARKNARPAKR